MPFARDKCSATQWEEEKEANTRRVGRTTLGLSYRANHLYMAGEKLKPMYIDWVGIGKEREREREPKEQNTKEQSRSQLYLYLGKQHLHIICT